jgi:hypothetical protein
MLALLFAHAVRGQIRAPVNQPLLVAAAHNTYGRPNQSLNGARGAHVVRKGIAEQMLQQILLNPCYMASRILHMPPNYKNHALSSLVLVAQTTCHLQRIDSWPLLS